MSLITCCPTCQTMFKVSGEDLRVSDGWVRCGKCNGVFDASAHLQMTAPAQDVSVQIDDEPQPAPFGPAGASSALPGFSGLQNALNDFSGASQSPAAQALATHAADTAQTSTQTSAPNQPVQAVRPMQAARFPSDERASFFRAATSGDVEVIEPTFAAELDELPPDLRAEMRPESSRAALRREDRSDRPASQEGLGLRLKERPLRRRSRAGWLAVLLVAAVLAALTGWVRQERQALVQSQPAWLAPLDALCTLLACEVQAPRMLEAISIEGTTLTETGPNEYQLELVLNNTRSHALALPGLNLSVSLPDGRAHRQTALPNDVAPGVLRLLAKEQRRVTLSVKVPPPAAADSALLSEAAPAAAAAATAAALPATSAPASAAALDASPVAAGSEPQSPQAAPTLSVTAFYP